MVKRSLDAVAQCANIVGMRHTMNISLPLRLKAEIEKAVQEGMYSSKSEFIRDLLRLWKNRKLATHLSDIAEARGEVKSKRVVLQKNLFKALGV